MATSLRELIVSVSADTTKYQREMDRASRMGAQYFRSVQDGGRTATSSWNTQTAAARTHANALEASTQAMTRYAAVAASAFGAARLVGLADQWTNISARVRLATESTAEFEMVQERLGQIADTTYRRYSEAADQFASTNRMMRELGFTTEDTLDAAEALGLALVAGGADAQRGATALDAWGKAVAQGRIGTEQWQTLLLQTPRVAQALANGLNKTTAEMTAMARAGQLTADVVVPALISQMDKLREEVESMPTEFQDAAVRAANALLKLVGSLNDSTGATAKMVAGVEILVEHMDTLVTIGGGAAMGALAGKMIQIGQGAASAAVGMVQSRMAAKAEALAIRDATAAGLAKAQADVRRAQAAMGAARGSAASATATRNYANALLVERQASIAAARAQEAYTAATSRAAIAKRAALGILGGPAGLAVTVGMVAAGWLLFRDNTDEAAAALDNWSGSADEAVAKFRELNKEQQVGAILRLEDQIAEAASDLEGIFSRIVSAANSFGGEAARGFTPAVQSIIGDFKAGAIGADEFSARLSAAVDEMLEGSPAAASVGRELKGMIASAAGSAVEIDRSRERLASFNEVNGAAQTQANATAGAITGQAGAMDVLGTAADAAGKKIQNALVSLPGQIERIGKSAAEVARLDVRDWFRGQAASGVNFANREDPQVRALMQQGEQYIRLMTEQDAKQRALAASTKALAAARRDAGKASAHDEYLAKLNEGYAEQVLSLERQIALHGDVGRSAAMAYDLANGSLSNLAQSQKDYLQGLADWLDWLDEMAALDQVWADTAKEHGKYADDAKGHLRGLEAFADQAARNMQSALGDSLYNILDGKFSGIADSFGDMLKRMSAELMASQIWQALGTALSGATGQGWWGNLARGIGGAMQGSTKGARAGGGPVAPFSAYDVTEHGDPELLSFGGRQVLLMGSKGGMVTPLMNRAGGGSGAGGPMRVEIVNSGPPVQAQRSEFRRGPDGEGLLRVFLSAVADDVASGGRTAAAIKSRYGLREAV